MKISEVLTLDCREYDNQQIVKQMLRKIEPLYKVGMDGNAQVPLEKIENLVAMIIRRYDVFVSVSLSFAPEGNNWCMASVRKGYANLGADDRGEAIEAVYGYCWYDLWSKLAIYLWAAMKNNKIHKRG